MSDKTKIVTFCNDGYINFCKNWLKSVENVGLQTDVLIFTLGNLSYDEMKKTNVDVIKCEDLFQNLDHLAEEFIEFETEKWCDITFLKLKVQKYVLEMGFDVLFSDSDVVFLKNDLLEVIKKNTKDFDGSFQMERNARSDCICTGFFYIKSNKKTINLLDIEKTKNICQYKNDQNLINTRIYIASNNSKTKRLATLYRNFIEGRGRHKFQHNARPHDINFYLNQYGWSVKDSVGFDWSRLDMNIFPWGPKWKTMNQLDKSKVKMVHYNGITGNKNKMNTMKQYNHWYI